MVYLAVMNDETLFLASMKEHNPTELLHTNICAPNNLFNTRTMYFTLHAISLPQLPSSSVIELSIVFNPITAENK